MQVSSLRGPIAIPAVCALHTNNGYIYITTTGSSTCTRASIIEWLVNHEYLAKEESQAGDVFRSLKKLYDNIAVFKEIESAFKNLLDLAISRGTKVIDGTDNVTMAVRAMLVGMRDETPLIRSKWETIKRDYRNTHEWVRLCCILTIYIYSKHVPHVPPNMLQDLLAYMIRLPVEKRSSEMFKCTGIKNIPL